LKLSLFLRFKRAFEFLFYFFLCFKLNFFFSVFKSFWCANVKNNFNKKNFILIYFQARSTLKSNRYHTLKHLVTLFSTFMKIDFCAWVLNLKSLILIILPLIMIKNWSILNIPLSYLWLETQKLSLHMISILISTFGSI